ncbi:Polypyrimidine tract-binding protein-like protein 3 [Diplonema papillatum]|nr:Polypyrimidine tract-binding protein-like protein 3 [Diplonema papillatum]
MSEVKLFVSGIPMPYVQADVEELFLPYGDVLEVHMLPLKGNNTSRSSFVRYGTTEEGTRAIEALNGVEFTDQADRLVVKHSSNSGRGAQSKTERGRNDRKVDLPGRPRAALPDRQPRRAGGGGGGPMDRGPLITEKKMLFFTVKNDPSNKINCKVMDKVLMQCGQPVKVLILPNGDGCQGWALMDQQREAERAIETLSGRNIFREDCLLHLELSDKKDLDVKFNNDYSWDYLSQLPTSSPILDEEPSRGGRGPRDGPPSRGGGGPAGRNNHPGMGMSAERGNNTSRSGGGVVLVNGITTEVDANGNRLLGTEELQKIMGVYGDVMRIKLLPPKGEDAKVRQALVQFRRVEEAEHAREKLNSCPLYGAKLAIHLSNKDDIRVPEDMDDTFADYHDSQSGRFGPHFPLHKLRQARPPSNVLYLSGLESSISDEDLLDFFAADGAIKAERFRAKKGEAKVEFTHIQDATAALVKHHGISKLGAVDLPRSLRIAFSDRTISDAPIQMSGGRDYDR